MEMQLRGGPETQRIESRLHLSDYWDLAVAANCVHFDRFRSGRDQGTEGHHKGLGRKELMSEGE